MTIPKLVGTSSPRAPALPITPPVRGPAPGYDAVSHSAASDRGKKCVIELRIVLSLRPSSRMLDSGHQLHLRPPELDAEGSTQLVHMSCSSINRPGPKTSNHDNIGCTWPPI
jgi:hypothetical protein